MLGKGIANLVNGRGKAKNVVFFEGLKQKYLSVCQMFDQGYDVIFHSKGYETKLADTSEVLTEDGRT